MTQGYQKPRSVNGAAILGDGHVGIILDVHGLESSAFGAA
jgi:chemotaxis protein histidine kinase CheA